MIKDAFPRSPRPWFLSLGFLSLGFLSLGLMRLGLMGLGLISSFGFITGAAADWQQAQRQTIAHGVQAVLMCNGLFTSHRSLEQVFDQELKYLAPPRFDGPRGSASTGPYQVDWAARAVTVGTDVPDTAITAVFREGFSCIVLPPATPATADVLQALPTAPEPLSVTATASLNWPDGDRVVIDLPEEVDQDALQQASAWAFERAAPEQVTVSLLVTRFDQVLLERYASGFDASTRTRTWSTAKSIGVTLLGMLVEDGLLNLDDPLPVDWLPPLAASETDPRARISLRQALQMTSGLMPVDAQGLEYQSGSGLAYWAGASAAIGARRRGLVRTPGTFWDYENYDTLLAVYAMRRVLGVGQSYHRFPGERLLNKLGMHQTLIGVDRFGDFILSSQVYSNARDLARLGLLYLNEGVWRGERLISQDWIEFVRTPVPVETNPKGQYGGHWWLVPADRDDVPKDAYATAGNRGQYVIVVPSHNIVIVRRGLDYGRQGFNRWDLTREVLKALPPR